MNPWLVESIQAFSFLNCPECDFRSKEENLFAYHAAKHHPLSTAFYEKQIELEQSTIALKTVELLEESCESFDNEYENTISQTQGNLLRGVVNWSGCCSTCDARTKRVPLTTVSVTFFHYFNLKQNTVIKTIVTIYGFQSEKKILD